MSVTKDVPKETGRLAAGVEAPEPGSIPLPARSRKRLYSGLGRPTLRKWLRRLLILVLCAVGIQLVRSQIWREEVLSVHVYPVDRGAVESTVTNTKAGTVRARRRAQISPGTSGIVKEVCVRRGAVVAVGEPLVFLDDSVQQGSLAVAQAAVQVAEAQLRRACLAAERAQHELKHHMSLVASGRRC